jgi:hypothetical protein
MGKKNRQKGKRKMSDKIEMTIKLQVTEAQALTLQAMFEYMNELGSVGASRYVAFYADGDGDFQPKAECTYSEPVRPLTDDMKKIAVVEDNHGHRKYDFDNMGWYIAGEDGGDPPK